MKIGSYIYTNSYAPADTNQLWVKPLSNGEAMLYVFVDGKWTPTGGIGESAYEAAVKEGFEGTKSEWIESLALKYSDLTAEQKADLAKDAVSAAERAAQAVENIENTINNIDISSTDGAITALAAKQGLLENELDALGPKIGYDISASATGSGGNIRAIAEIAVSASDKVYIKYTQDSTGFTAVLRFHNIDGTTSNVTPSAVSSFEGEVTASNDADYIEAVRYGSEAVNGHTNNLVVKTGVLKDLLLLKTETNESIGALQQMSTETAQVVANVGRKISSVATASGTSIDVKVNGTFPIGTRLYVNATCDNPKMSYTLRIHNTDDTFTQVEVNPSYLTLDKEADYVQAVNYATAISGATLTLSVYTNSMADMYNESQAVAPKFNELLSRVSVYNIEWEFGNINLSASGWEYVNYTKRIRTKKGTSIHLYPNDVIGLTDYTNNVYYIGWKNTDGSYGVGSGWLQSDFTVQYEGDYVVIIRKNPEVELSTVESLSDLFYVKSLKAKIDDVGKTIGGTTELSGTTTAGNYFLNMPYIMKAGESVNVEANVSSNDITYGVRFSYSDGTLSNGIILQAKGHSVGVGTAEKDVTAIQLYSFNSIASCTASIKCYKGLASTTRTFSQEITSLDNSVGWKIPSDKFELGSINGSASGLSYVASATRARLANGVMIHLAAGDVIGLTNYIDKKFYLLGYSGDTFISQGWNTSDFTIALDGEYSLVITNQTEVNLTSAKVLSDYLFIKRANGLLAYIERTIGGTSSAAPLKGEVFSVGHRGHCQNLLAPVRPENTMASFKYAKELGYAYIETDIQITSDGEYVLCHDTTIDRTSNGTGTISQMTLAELRQYKFGYLNGNAIGDYANEQIPTLEEFLIFCHRVGIHAFLELEGQRTQQNCADIIDIIKSCGMYGNVTILSIPRLGNLAHFHTLDETIDLCALQAATDDVIDQTLIDAAVGLKGTKNKVCIGAHTYTSEEVAMCIEAGLPLGIYTINNAQTALALPSYVSFITTDTLDYAKILREAAMA